MHTYIHIYTYTPDISINFHAVYHSKCTYLAAWIHISMRTPHTYIHTYIPNYLPNPHITHQVTWSWSRYCCHRWSLRLRHCMAPARAYRHTLQVVVWEKGHLNISGRQRRTCHGNLSWKLTWTALFQWWVRSLGRMDGWPCGLNFLYSYLEWMNECVSTWTKILMWNICSMYICMHTCIGPYCLCCAK